MNRFLLLLILLFSLKQTCFALTSHEVLVVYNTREPLGVTSQAVAKYYANARYVPPSNLVGLSMPTIEKITESEYASYVAGPLWDNYLSQPEYSHIKSIVLCYGIPSRIDNGLSGLSHEEYSVDTTLALLDSTTRNQVFWGKRVTNPYSGKNSAFGVFRDSAENITDYDWKLNYLVCRLEAFSYPTQNVTVPIDGVTTTVAISSDVKDMIDKSVNATPGGKYVLDTPGANSYKQYLISTGITASDVIADETNTFVTSQEDVIGYIGEHFSENNANTYTTWGRPLNNWHSNVSGGGGGVALPNTNDGHSFRLPKYCWGNLTSFLGNDIEPYKIKVKLPDGLPFIFVGQVLLRSSSDGLTRASGVLANGIWTIDLSNVSWPADQKTFVELRYPVNDPIHPDEQIAVTTPTTADTFFYDSRQTGFYMLYRKSWQPMTSVVESGKLKVTDMHKSDSNRTSTDQYAGHQVVLYAYGNTGGYEIARGTFNWGSCSIDLSTIDWDNIPWVSEHLHECYIELHFPVNDPDYPDYYIPNSKSPSIADQSIWANRQNGIMFSCGYDNGSSRLTRNLAAGYIRDGASGAISEVDEPNAVAASETSIFTRYFKGYSWAESAYMGIGELSAFFTILGDPLMAPNASHPTFGTVGPFPQTGDHVNGTVPFPAISLDGSGTMNTQVWLIDESGSDNSLGSFDGSPFAYRWDTSGYTDGEYRLDIAADQSGDHPGNTLGSWSLTLDTTQIPAISLSSVSNNAVITPTTTITASVTGTVESVQLWLFGNGNPILADEATGPYQFNIPSSVSGGEYVIQAVAVDRTGAIPYSVFSEPKTIRFTHDSLGNLSDVSSLSDGDTLYLSGLPVVEGSSSTTDYPLTQGHAFYLEDPDRNTGIRVESANSVETGKSVSVVGILHESSSIRERYIEAMHVWDEGTATIPEPVSMRNDAIGGKDTDDADGNPNPGLGNVGLSVRTCGTVTYVGSNFAYIWDGSNALDGYNSAAKGVRVYFGDFTLPEVDSYITITGISSAELISGNHGRMIRARPNPETYSGTVTYVGSNFAYVDDGNHAEDGNTISAPRIVPQNGDPIPSAEIGVKGRKVIFGNLQMPGIDDEVEVTGRSCYENIDDSPVPMMVMNQNDLTYTVQHISARGSSNGVVTLDGQPISPGTKVKLVDFRVHAVVANYFIVKPPNIYLPVWISIPATVALGATNTVTITGEVMPDRSGEGFLQVDASEDHIYFGGSAYGALSIGTKPSNVKSASSFSSTSTSSKNGKVGREKYNPWPYPTPEEVLASDWFKQCDSQVGAIGWALSQPDGAIIDLPVEAICGVWYEGRVLGLKEWFEPLLKGPRLFLYLDKPVGLDALKRNLATIDIIGGKLVTLPNGTRALIKPEAVYAYTDASSRRIFSFPCSKYVNNNGGTDGFDNWPWKLKVAP